jgi:hypothetical protein
MLTLTIMIALHREEEFKLHLRPALKNGVTFEELRAMLLQSSIYAGVPARTRHSAGCARCSATRWLRSAGGTKRISRRSAHGRGAGWRGEDRGCAMATASATSSSP